MNQVVKNYKTISGPGESTDLTYTNKKTKSCGTLTLRLPVQNAGGTSWSTP